LDGLDAKKGRLVVIEGIDGSGKTTQYELLKQRLNAKAVPHMGVSFPNYGSLPGRLVKNYLDGQFGKNPSDVNAYAAASFFAIDRYVSFKTDPWGDYYRNGGFVISSRYSTSNAIHQASKLPEAERESYFKWLSEYEYELLGLPKPDEVFYLDVPLEAAIMHISSRETQSNTPRDIHEKDREYLISCINTGRHAARYYGWTKVNVMCGNSMMSPEEIGNYLYEKILKYI
jgi:dTMP kinase